MDRAVWTRVDGIGGGSLDLMTARFGRHHYAPHTHEEYAIGVCVDGLETMRYRGERIYCGAGTILAIDPGEPHTGGPATAAGYAYRVMYPTDALLPEGPVHFRRPIVHDAWLAGEMERTHLLLIHGADPLEGETRLLELLSTLVRRHAVSAVRTARSSSAADAMPGAVRVARDVMSRLGDRLIDPPNLTEIATDLGLSRYQVLRAFRAAVGMPPYAWLAQHRVNRAKALLENDHGLADVAALVGFADQAHLTRWFRRVLGVTPGAYRNSVQDRLPHRA